MVTLKYLEEKVYLASLITSLSKKCACSEEKNFAACTDKVFNILGVTYRNHKIVDTLQKLTGTSIIHVSCGIHST